jgi:hypothetical protein
VKPKPKLKPTPSQPPRPTPSSEATATHHGLADLHSEATTSEEEELVVLAAPQHQLPVEVVAAVQEAAQLLPVLDPVEAAVISQYFLLVRLS